MRTRTIPLLSAVALCYSVFAAAASTSAVEAAAETNPVTPTDVAGMTESDGWVYFAGRTEPLGAELWRSDGRTIELVADINPGPASSNPFHMVPLSSWLYFRAETDDHGSELWRTNGITTELVADLEPGPGDSWPSDLAHLEGRIYFRAYTPGTGYSLWRTDGSSTELIGGTEGTSPRGMVAMDGWLYYSGYAPGTYRDLWRSNGVTTELVADIQPGDSSPSYLEVLDGWVYFSANTPAAGDELWRSNGVITELVADINPTGSSGPYDMTAMGGWVYFAATGSDSDNELWRSDGAITELVSDINPGPGYSRPEDLEALGGWVYFRAETPQTGAELWRTDGVVTELVADINPGPRSSEPSHLGAIGGWVYFGASNLQYLWRSDGVTTERVGVPWELLLSDYIDTRDDEVPAWMSTNYRPDVTGVHTLALEWVGDTDVSIAVREAGTGRWVGDDTSDDAPKFLEVALEAGIEYRVATWVRDGGTAFTMSIGTTSSPPTGEELLMGTVDATGVAGPRWTKTFYTAPVTGEHSFTLDWAGDANLRIGIKESVSGSWIGANTGSNHPKLLTVQLVAGVEYRVAVWSMVGAADFTVTLMSQTPPPCEPILRETVDATGVAGPRWTKTFYTAPVTGEHSFTLDWAGDANLRIGIKESVSGNWIGANTGSNHPKLLTVQLVAGVEYRVAVWSMVGAADFTVTLC